MFGWEKKDSEQGSASGWVYNAPSLPTVPSCRESLPGIHSGDIHIWSWNIFLGHLHDETTLEKADLYGWMHTGTWASWTLTNSCTLWSASGVSKTRP